MLKSKFMFAEVNGYKFSCDPVALAFVRKNADARDNIHNAFYYDFCSWGNWKAFDSGSEIEKYISNVYSQSTLYSGVLYIEVEKGDKAWELRANKYDLNDGTGYRFEPVRGAEKALKRVAVEGIDESVKGILGDDYKSDCVYLNLWRLALKAPFDADAILASIDDRIANPDAFKVYGAVKSAPKPAAPAAAQAPAQVQVVERVIERQVEKATPLEDLLNKAVCEMVAKTAVDDMVPRIKQRLVEEFGFEPVRHEIVIAGKPPVEMNKITHRMFEKVLFFIANKTPIYLYGPAGSGKNHMVEQIAEAMKLKFYTSNSVTEEWKFTGFMDVNGNYRESEFYKAFTQGGIFFLDEIDASCAEVLVNLNAAIANGYFPFPNGTKRAHEDFRVVAAGNTLGTGADASYTGRTQLDAATLNRFVVVPVDYDERIDLLNANGDQTLVDFAKGYRIAAKRCGLATVCSYRNIKMVKTAEAAMDTEEALLFSLTKEMNKDDINTIIGQFPVEYRNNKYYNALSRVQPMC